MDESLNFGDLSIENVLKWTEEAGRCSGVGGAGDRRKRGGVREWAERVIGGNGASTELEDGGDRLNQGKGQCQRAPRRARRPRRVVDWLRESRSTGKGGRSTGSERRHKKKRGGRVGKLTGAETRYKKRRAGGARLWWYVLARLSWGYFRLLLVFYLTLVIF